jgi:hypothetical protein
MVRMGCGDVYNVDIWVLDEFEVGAVSFRSGGGADRGQEILSSAGRGRRSSSSDDMFNIMNVARGRICEDIFCESWVVVVLVGVECCMGGVSDDALVAMPPVARIPHLTEKGFAAMMREVLN